MMLMMLVYGARVPRAGRLRLEGLGFTAYGLGFRV